MKIFKFVVLSSCLFLAPLSFSDYSQQPQVAPFIDRMVEDHQFERAQVIEWLKVAENQQSIVKAMSRPAEKVKPWHEYRKIFVTELRVKRGVEFWQQHEETLERAYKEYGVDPAIIVSILGVETNYGRNTGSYRVIDAL
ncbi:lytic murein transglycosylase, partial [Porticoccaceae bacterium]|nr:lytic murein transglycosylase [Porticoccaceae bacterium]